METISPAMGTRAGTRRKRVLTHSSSHDKLMDAGFDTHSAGPIRWRCHVRRGTWKSGEYEGYPLRWDLCMDEARQVYPELFASS